MNLPAYPVQQIEPLVFTFISRGKKGSINKIILYELLQADIFNLCFGDLDSKTLEIDDSVNSDNGDIVKVMATVLQTIPLFFQKYPDGKIYFEGSDVRRTKFYNRIISNRRFDLEKTYYLEGGFSDGSVEFFRENMDYSYFLIAKKKE